MATKKVSEKTRNGGKWTEAAFAAFIRGGLRSLTMRWGPKYDVLKEAFRGRSINDATGRMCMKYECAKCEEVFPAKEVQVDHIEPIGVFTNWTDCINRMFCEADNLQVLCKPCHVIKTNKESK